MIRVHLKLDIENGNKKIKMNSNIKYIIRRKKDGLELSIFSYSEKTESFELGNIHILDIFGKESIIKVCEAFDVQYIPLN